jgi:hypothetical protein
MPEKPRRHPGWNKNDGRTFAQEISIVTFAVRNTARPPKQAKFFRITSCQNAAALWLIDG